MTTGPRGEVWEWEEGFLPQESWRALVRKNSRDWVESLLHEGRRRKRRLAASPRSTSWSPGLAKPSKGRHTEQERPERSEPREGEK